MSKLIDVTLHEPTHTYSDSYGLKYDSVSSIIAHFKEKFDPNKLMSNGRTLIENYVAKNGHTAEYWLNEWEKNKNHRCDVGSAFHKAKEDMANFSQFLKHDIKTFPVRRIQEETDRNPGIDYSQLPDGAYQELTLFNRRHMIAGQADKVIIEKPYFDIDDYKTNGDFKTESFKPPRGKHKMMAPPFAHLMDCHLGHYTVQLSIYAWMLMQFGLIPRNLRILHYQIRQADEKAVLEGKDINVEPTIYMVKFQETAVEKALAYYRSRINRLK